MKKHKKGSGSNASNAHKSSSHPMHHKNAHHSEPDYTNQHVEEGIPLNISPQPRHDVVSKPKIINKINAEPPKFSPTSERDAAMQFAEKIHKKFGLMIKSSILFGSQAKNTATSGSDIDIIVIIDDASINWDLELISWYREELGKILAASEHTKDLHINTVKLTTWWQDLLKGDPVVINVLRYGEALIDSGGFFNPIKALLLQGKIYSTPEAVYDALQRAPMHLLRSKAAEMGAIEGVYWAMVDSAQAALMTAGKMPPSPEHIPDFLTETFVTSGMLKMNFVKSIKDLYSIHKGIAHGTINDVKGAEIDAWQDTADRFLSEMTRIINTILDSKKQS